MAGYAICYRRTRQSQPGGPVTTESENMTQPSSKSKRKKMPRSGDRDHSYVVGYILRKGRSARRVTYAPVEPEWIVRWADGLSDSRTPFPAWKIWAKKADVVSAELQ